MCNYQDSLGAPRMDAPAAEGSIRRTHRRTIHRATPRSLLTRTKHMRRHWLTLAGTIACTAAAVACSESGDDTLQAGAQPAAEDGVRAMTAPSHEDGAATRGAASAASEPASA